MMIDCLIVSMEAASNSTAGSPQNVVLAKFCQWQELLLEECNDNLRK